jgi:hypothetical protein
MDRMTEEAAKELAAAMRQLAEAITKLSAGSFGGIQVYHHGFPQPAQQQFQQWPIPTTTW